MAGKKTPQVQPTAADETIAPPANTYLLFKGATRIPTIKGGVPTRAFVVLVFFTVTVAMFTRLGWLLFPIFYPVVAIISRNDDRAFWIWELWFKTKFRAPNKRFWGAVSLTPTPYNRQRPWLRRARGNHP